MTVPSPEAIRQRQRLSLRASLQAALAALPIEEDEIVVVPAAGDMSLDTFRKHCKARGHNARTIPEHNKEHNASPALDHVHDYRRELL
jgi:hypothetical protein